MASDPLNIFGNTSPLGGQRTQPTSSQMQDDRPRDRFDDALDSFEKKRKAEEARRLTETPADAAKRARLARELGMMPSEIVDTAMAERMVSVRKQMDMRDRYPAIGRFFDDNPDAAAAALKDDGLPNLAQIWDGVKKAPGRLAVAGSLGVLEMMSSSIALMSNGKPVSSGPGGIGAATNAMRVMEPFFESERDKARKTFGSDNWYVDAVLGGLESVPLTIAAAVTRNPVAGASLIGGLVGLDSAREGQKKGLSTPQALLYGALQGVPEAAFEILPMGELMKLGGRGFVSGFGRYMMAEVPGEMLTTASQSFTDWAMLPENKDRSLRDWALGLDAELGQTVLGVLGGGTVTVTTMQGMQAVGRFAERRQNQRLFAEAGKFEGDLLNRLGGYAQASTLRQEDPEKFADLMRQMAADAGVSTVLVDGQAIRDYLQSDAYEGENDPLTPYAQAAQEAAAAGNDVALPIETALTVLPGSAAWNALRDDMRLTAGGMSKRQADAFEASEQMMLDELAKQVEATDSKAKQQGQAREAMIQKVQTKLEEDGGFTPAEAQRQAEVLVARMSTRAARMGRDQDAVDKAIDSLRIRTVLPPELARAMQAQEQDMVVAVLRGNEKGSTSRARAAAQELRAELARRGWTPEQMSDEQLQQVLDRFQTAGENDGREYRAGRGDGGGAGGKYAPLDGATKARGWHGPVRELVDAAEEYARRAGIDLKRQAYFITKERFDVEFATRIAEAYEAMEHAPNDPAVLAAYEAMIAETRAQYDVLVEFGYSFSFFGNDDDPYEGNPFNAMRDLRDTKTMAVYSTIAGYGSGYSEAAVDEHPLLADTGLEWPDQNGNMVKVLANDLFRAVHDAFGHGLEGAGFRYDGEENAWQAHARLFSPAALPALTSETRGQNSWLNFGPLGEGQRFAVLDDTTFADQKAGLLPSWAWTENVVPDMEPTDGRLDEALVAGGSALAAAGGVEIGWTPERIDDLLRTHGYTSDPEKSKALAGRLTPDQFLGLTASAKGRRLIRERVEGMEEYGGGIDFERMRQNSQAPFLIVAAEGGFTANSLDDQGNPVKTEVPFSLRVVGHEGRHRMTMLKGAGVTSVPVVIVVQDARGKDIPESAQLGPQRSRSDQVATGDQVADLEGLIPISYANRERLVAEFSRGRELFQSGWHGSPHIFDRFSLDFMGTGEGNQAFGWGLYFTSLKEIGQYYRDQLGAQWRDGDSIAWGGKTALARYEEAQRAGRYGEAMVLERILMHESRTGIVSYLQEGIAEEDQQAIDGMAYLETLPAEAFAPTSGRLYEVELPENDEFMDWNAPLSQQSDRVKAGLEQLGISTEDTGEKYPMTGADAYAQLRRELGDPRLASLALLRVGIVGNRYKAETLGVAVGRAQAEGATNYVLFDDQRVEIRSYEQATIFYSALERAAEAVKTERAPAQQWIATLKNAPGVKAEELEWTGIIDWLEAQTGQVDKAQVVETIQRGGIVVREIDLTAEPDEDAIEQARYEIEDELREIFEQDYEGPYRVNEYDEEVEGSEEGETRTFFTVESDSGEDFVFDTEDEAQEKADELNAEAESEAFYDWLEYQDTYSDAVERARNNGAAVKWQSYSLAEEDDTTYFEWLMTLPLGEQSNPTGAPRTHWDQEGVVIHVRGHERTGANGKRILFLDEIQSDWHQQAASRFTEAKAEAVRGFFAMFPNQDKALQAGVSEALYETMREAIAERKAHRAWPDIVKWLEVNPSDEGAALLQSVADANRGYKAPPDPEKIERLRAAKEEAQAAIEAPYETLVSATEALQAEVKPQLDQWLASLDKRIEDAARAEEVARGKWELAESTNPELFILRRNATDAQNIVDRLRTLRGRVQRLFSGNAGSFNFYEVRTTMINADLLDEFETLSKTEAYQTVMTAERLWQEAVNLSNLRDREYEVAVAGGAGIPDAPFKDTWPIVAVKRMIGKAAAEGYDQIAWIKQGENNGGMDDDVDWFYGRNLPNMVNKLLKPYKGRVVPLYVSGLEAPDTPESEAFDDVTASLRRYGLGAALGLSEQGFATDVANARDRIVREIAEYERLAENARKLEDRYDIDLYTRRAEETRQVLAKFDAASPTWWQKFSEAREAYIPGLAALDERAAQTSARQIELTRKASFLANRLNLIDDEAAAREYFDYQVGKAKELLASKQPNIEFHERVIAAIRAAQEAGQETAVVEELTYPVTADDLGIASHQNSITNLRKEEAALREIVDQVPSFDAALAAARELAQANADVRRMQDERTKLLQRPTNLGFDITPELREAAASGFPLFQPDHRNMPRGRILFPGNDDQGAVIELFQGRDLSTLLHESSHLWLEELKADAADPNAPEQIKRDWQIVLDWFKANGHEVRDGIIPVGAHELWARGGERYFREGKAPSVGLKRAFETFRSWLVNLYKTVRGLNAPITPEIREVFDRLLATDEEISEARRAQGMEALFNTAMEAGMSADEFANYQEQVESARAEAQGRVLEKAMADIAKRETRLGRERRREIKDKVTEGIEQTPLFRALSILKEERMSRAAIEARFGADIIGQLPSRVPPIYANEGADPEIIAERAGFPDVQTMIDAMVQAETEQQAAKAGGDKRSMKARMIDQMTDAAFAMQYGEAMTPDQIRQEALDAVANDRQGEVIASEIAALARKTKKPPTPYQVARQWARSRVRQGLYVTEASKSALERHRRAIAAAGREAEQAMLAGDMEAVYRAKQKQMLSSALLSEAKAAHEEVEVARARMERIAKARTMKTVDQDYLEQAHALLEEVELKQRSQRSIDRFDKWSAWVAAREAEGHEVIVPDTFMAQIGMTNWSRLPVEQLLGLDAAIGQIMHFGRLKQTLIDNQDRRAYEAVKAEIKATAALVGKKEPKSDFAEPGWWDSFKSRIAGWDAALLKAETIFDWLDNGNPNGAFNRYVFRPIARAAAQEADMLRDFYARHKANLEAIPAETLRTWGDKLNTGWMERKTGLPLVLTRQQVIAMALNWGNAGNRQRLVDGYGLSEIAVENFLMKTLTADEWLFVQRTWDTIGELWPMAAAMERRVNGVEPEKIEAIQFNTPHGPMRGGYYPAIYNTQIDRKARGHAEQAEDLFNAKTTRATTRASATKARSETVKRPILLDLGVITRHMGEMIHDITHREAVIQAYKLLTDPEVLDEIDSVLGREYSDQLRPWVKYVANRWDHERAGNEGIARFFSKLRANATVVGMGFRFSTMTMQLAGYSNSIEYVGAAPMAEAIAKFSASPVETTAFVREKSGEMRNRFDTLDRDVNQEIRRMAQPGVASKAAQVATAGKTFAFHGIGYMDMVVTVPTWMAAYNKALAAGMTDEQAIYAGDKAVRLSQGSGDAKDLAAVQRGTGPWGEALKLMTMFYSYMSAFYQRQRRLGRDTGRAVMEADIAAFPGLLARAWWLLVVPPILSELLAMRGPDDDEDPAWWAFRKMLSQSLGPIPLVRDLWEPLYARITDKPSFGYRFTPIQGFGESIINVAGDIGNVAEGEPTKRMTRNVLELVGFSTGLVPGQIATATQFLVDVGEGEQDPQTAGEWFEGLTKGKIAEE